jgi:hypothetical protein
MAIPASDKGLVKQIGIDVNRLANAKIISQCVPVFGYLAAILREKNQYR